MIYSLSALTGKSFSDFSVDEVVSGTILDENNNSKIGSFFNIPLVIAGSVSGVLTIAHKDEGLYKEEDMTILYKITGQASEAVSRLQDVVKMEKGKLNAMVESMADGVLMFDTEYRIIVANPAVLKIIKNVDGKPTIFDFIDLLSSKFDIKGRLEESIIKNVSSVSDKLEIGGTFFEIGIYPVTPSNMKGEKKVIGSVVVFHDISRDMEIEKVREEFTHMIVHELRSPIDGIKKILELIIKGVLDFKSQEFKNYIDMAYQNSSSMLELVNDILDLSKLQAGKFVVDKEPNDIKETVDNRVTFYKLLAESRKLNIASNIDSLTPLSIVFDGQAVKQILNNFISNSLKFTNEGGNILVSVFVLGPKIQIPQNIIELADSKSFAFPLKKDFKIKNKSLCVVVSDNGIGIPKTSLENLFIPYSQARLAPVQKDSKGTGLGLAIAKGIVEAHKG